MEAPGTVGKYAIIALVKSLLYVTEKGALGASGRLFRAGARGRFVAYRLGYFPRQLVIRTVAGHKRHAVARGSVARWLGGHLKKHTGRSCPDQPGAIRFNR